MGLELNLKNSVWAFMVYCLGKWQKTVILFFKEMKYARVSRSWGKNMSLAFFAYFSRVKRRIWVWELRQLPRHRARPPLTLWPLRILHGTKHLCQDPVRICPFWAIPSSRRERFRSDLRSLPTVEIHGKDKLQPNPLSTETIRPKTRPWSLKKSRESPVTTTVKRLKYRWWMSK